MKATFKSGDMKMHLEENIDEETRKCRWVVMVWPVVKKQAAAISEQKVGAGEGKTETVHVNAQIIALICSFPPREESIKLV